MEKVPVYLYPCALTGSSPTEEEEKGCAFQVVFDEPDRAGFALSKRFISYILDSAICTRCLEIIDETTHLSTCEKPAKSDSWWCSPRNRMCYIPTEKLEEFRKFWDRERARYRQNDRKSKLAKMPLPPEGILLQLKETQENRCYYCFNEFETNSSNLKPHLDHFVSVANGGSNSIFNLVYACGRCNREKFSENGDQFIIRRRELPPEQRLKIMKDLVQRHCTIMPDHDSPEFGKWTYESMRLWQRQGRIEREIRESSAHPSAPTRLLPSDIHRNVSKMRESVKEWKEQFKPEYLSHVESLHNKHLDKMPHTKTPEFDKWLDEEFKLLLRLECIQGEIR